jgi:hypothetical protein
MEELRTQERLERIEEELAELNDRLETVIEAVSLLAPQRYSPPWSENRLTAELHRARHT